MQWLCALLLLLSLLPAHAAAEALPFRLERLPPGPGQTAAAVRSGRFDTGFVAARIDALREVSGPAWFRLVPEADWRHASAPALVVRQTRYQVFTVYPADGSPPTALGALQADFPAGQTRGVLVFPLGGALRAGQPVLLMARTEGDPTGLRPQLRIVSADQARAESLQHVRLASIATGALLALAACALCVWAVSREKLFLAYAALLGTQGLYVALLFYDGFFIPASAIVFASGARAPNMAAALGAYAALYFAQCMTDTRRIAPRLDRLFGGLRMLCLVLLVLTPAATHTGMIAIMRTGNLLVLVGALAIVAAGIIGWRRGSRAAGFFLIAWLTMQGFTIARTVSEVITSPMSPLIYYGFPLSMVVAGILLALGLADRIRELQRALHAAERRARIDALTGVLTRRSILERFDAARARFRDTGEPLSVLFVDLDHFKRINDTHGHAAGDACLREAARRIAGTVRHHDAVGRYGGEEFVVLLEGADQHAAVRVAEALRAGLASAPVAAGGTLIRFTCSIGCASSGSSPLSAEDLIARADAALYAAKRGGRNRVVLATADAAPATLSTTSHGAPDDASLAPAPR